jgi:hypothetical protein
VVDGNEGNRNKGSGLSLYGANQGFCFNGDGKFARFLEKRVNLDLVSGNFL